MGARTYWVAPVPPLLYASGTPATNTTPAADFSPAPQITIYPGVLELGTTIHLYAQGELSTGTTADTLTIGFYYGGASSGVALAGASAVAVATGGSAETSVPWEMDYWGTVGALGSSGTIKGMGRFYGPNIATPLTGAYSIIPIPQSAAARTVTINTTTANTITTGAFWSAATGSPTITCYALKVELIG